MQQAEALLDARQDTYMRFAPDIRILATDALRASFPRFKVIGLRLFIALAPAEAFSLPLAAPGAIVRSEKRRLPLPSLAALTQSLLDTANFADLADLVDGMDLTAEWAAAVGLRLSVDAGLASGRSPREKWESLLATKQKRMGLKYDPKYYKTRFILRGKKPRVRH
jgi:hypothetical protein